MTLVIITGEIDLSVASVLGLTCTVVGQLWVTGIASLPLLVGLALVLGAVLGAVNGAFVTAFGLPSLAVTIGTLALYRGLAYVVLGDQAVANYPVDWTVNAIAPIPGTTIPWAIVVVAVLAVLFGLILHATPIGRAIFAIGNNAEAARFSGVAVARVKFWLFVATGAMAALAGVFWTFRFASARADTGAGIELAVVAAVLLGGVSIFGGRGAILGVVAAVVLLATLRNALQLAYVPANTLTVVTGSLLIASVVGPNLVGMVRQRVRRRSTASATPVSVPSNKSMEGSS
jgi:rhamnose transport system permease protein